MSMDEMIARLLEHGWHVGFEAGYGRREGETVCLLLSGSARDVEMSGVSASDALRVAYNAVLAREPETFRSTWTPAGCSRKVR